MVQVVTDVEVKQSPTETPKTTMDLFIDKFKELCGDVKFNWNDITDMAIYVCGASWKEHRTKRNVRRQVSVFGSPAPAEKQPPLSRQHAFMEALKEYYATPTPGDGSEAFEVFFRTALEEMRTRLKLFGFTIPAQFILDGLVGFYVKDGTRELKGLDKDYLELVVGSLWLDEHNYDFSGDEYVDKEYLFANKPAVGLYPAFLLLNT